MYSEVGEGALSHGSILLSPRILTTGLSFLSSASARCLIALLSLSTLFAPVLLISFSPFTALSMVRYGNTRAKLSHRVSGTLAKYMERGEVVRKCLEEYMRANPYSLVTSQDFIRRMEQEMDREEKERVLRRLQTKHSQGMAGGDEK